MTAGPENAVAAALKRDSAGPGRKASAPVLAFDLRPGEPDQGAYGLAMERREVPASEGGPSPVVSGFPALKEPI